MVMAMVTHLWVVNPIDLAGGGAVTTERPAVMD
jgi:hypothetical protein